MKETDKKIDLAPLAAMFLDVVAWMPGLRTSLERDFCRVQGIINTRGCQFLFIDMPKACKVIDQALSFGTYFPNQLPETFGRLIGGYRPFLRCLVEKVFDETGKLVINSDTPNAIFFLRQALCLFKKVEIDCAPTGVQSAFREFVTVDSRMKVPTLTWESDTLDVSNHTLSLTDGYKDKPDMVSPRDPCPRALVVLLQLVSDRMVASFPLLDWRVLIPGHGPGSVSDARRGTDKYLFKYWPEKLEGFFPYNYFAQSREDLHLEEARTPVNHEFPSKLIAVRKTVDKPRLIASEPVAHQYCQKALMRWVRDNIPHSLRRSIDFHDQEPSRQLCLKSSLSGELATVDLSSASDLLSLWTIERVFRRHPELLLALHASRTRYCVVKDPITGTRDFLTLRKFATQGSSMTFPIQTITFALCALAAVLFENGGRINARSIAKALGKIRVFGDDIIMPSYAVSSLTLLLDHLGLKVNMGKTHAKGNFRESCGIDAFNGVDVTPLYMSSLELGRRPEDIVSWIDVSNNAYRKGLWTLSSWMVDQIPEKIRRFIPVTNRSLSCITLSTYQDGLASLRPKWDKTTQQDVIPALQVQGRTAQGERQTSQNLLQYFVEDPDPDVFWRHGYTVKVTTRLRVVRVPSL